MKEIEVLEVQKIVENPIKNEMIENPIDEEIEDINVRKIKFLGGIWHYSNHVVFFNYKDYIFDFPAYRNVPTYLMIKLVKRNLLYLNLDTITIT